jgi:hypothetical protein
MNVKGAIKKATNFFLASRQNPMLAEKLSHVVTAHDTRRIIKTPGGDGKGYCIDGCQYNVCSFLKEDRSTRENNWTTYCLLFDREKRSTEALPECDSRYGACYEGSP